MKPGPRAKEFGDDNYKGNGTIKCAVCGKSLSKHTGFGPCPELRLAPGERMILTKSLRTQTNKQGEGEKEQRRKRKNTERHEVAPGEQKAKGKVSESKAKPTTAGKGR